MVYQLKNGSYNKSESMRSHQSRGEAGRERKKRYRGRHFQKGFKRKNAYDHHMYDKQTMRILKGICFESRQAKQPEGWRWRNVK